MDMIETGVAIVGGGPVGLMLAIELGCRGVDAMLIEEDLDPPNYPKANANSARTMEHYRRRGFAHTVRALGLAEDHPQDVAYFTQLMGRELARFRIPSSAQARDGSFRGDFDERAWPTPELPHRAQQMFIEPVLRRELARYASVKTLYGWRAEDVRADGKHAQLLAREVASGRECAVRARYAVGCDGARSTVRRAMGATLVGEGGAKREFFGGMMAGLYFRSPELTHLLRERRAWQLWVASPRRRGIVVALDGDDHFVAGVQMAPEQTVEQVDVQQMLDDLVGARFTYENLGTNAWLAGYALVADRYRAGPLLLAGDAAHLFTPAAGMGYNTGVDDAVNLGWKLAAVLQGWGGEALVDSYEAERRPIGERNTGYARMMADSMAALRPPPELEEAGPEGDAARAGFAERCRDHLLREYQIPGLQLGLRYDSAVVLGDGSATPPDEPNHYEPVARPGSRAPHAWLGKRGDVSLFDGFGRDVTVLCDAQAGVRWQSAATEAGVPLHVMPWPDAKVRALYDAPAVLIRPDHHVAWRGVAGGREAALLRAVSGQAASSP